MWPSGVSTSLQTKLNSLKITMTVSIIRRKIQSSKLFNVIGPIVKQLRVSLLFSLSVSLDMAELLKCVFCKTFNNVFAQFMSVELLSQNLFYSYFFLFLQMYENNLNLLLLQKIYTTELRFLMAE